MICNKEELASVFGVSLPTVKKWLDKGLPHVKKERSFEINSREAIVWLYGLEPNLKSRSEIQDSLKTQNEAPEDELDPIQERARKDKYSADKLKLEIDIKTEKLIDKKAIEAEFSGMIIEARNKLMAIPNRMAVVLQNVAEAREVEAILDKEIRNCLIELGNEEG